MLRRLDNVIDVLGTVRWPGIEYAFDEDEFESICVGVRLVRYHFMAFNKEFNITFQNLPISGHYKIIREGRRIEGIAPVNYNELFFYLMCAFSLLFKEAELDDFYEFIEYWCLSTLMDMNQYHKFKSEMEQELRAVWNG